MAASRSSLTGAPHDAKVVSLLYDHGSLPIEAVAVGSSPNSLLAVREVAAVITMIGKDTPIAGSAVTGLLKVGPQEGLNLDQPHAAVPCKGSNSYAEV